MITLQLTQEDIEMCLTGIGNTYSYTKAFPLIEKIRQQAQPQLIQEDDNAKDKLN